MEKFLNSLPIDIKILDLSNKNLTILPDLTKFTNLVKLYFHNNQIKELNNLPNTLQELDCSSNSITELNNLPNTLQGLNCSNNQIIKLNNLPNTLQGLNCSNNQIIKLNNLPNTLQVLYCSSNYISDLIIPNTLQQLSCSNNNLLLFDLHEYKKLNKFIKFYKIHIILKSIFMFIIYRRCAKYKEELISVVYHPKRLFKYFNYDTDDLEEYLEDI
jgi:Leucine-rich repeat (LRR) protein